MSDRAPDAGQPASGAQPADEPRSADGAQLAISAGGSDPGGSDPAGTDPSGSDPSGSDPGGTDSPAAETELQRGVDDPDSFQRLWTPHRLAYVKRGDDGGGCPFCALPASPDDEALIVARGHVAYAVLNLYPYNPGHLMLVPYRHVADYTDLTDVELVEIAALTQAAMRALRAVAEPHGFNVGLNLGTVAGAGIAAHLHQHVVPRWGGDTNFMPVVGQTRVLPQLLADTRATLAAAWPGAAAP